MLFIPLHMLRSNVTFDSKVLNAHSLHVLKEILCLSQMSSTHHVFIFASKVSPGRLIFNENILLLIFTFNNKRTDSTIYLILD